MVKIVTDECWSCGKKFGDEDQYVEVILTSHVASGINKDSILHRSCIDCAKGEAGRIPGVNEDAVAVASKELNKVLSQYVVDHGPIGNGMRSLFPTDESYERWRAKHDAARERNSKTPPTAIRMMSFEVNEGFTAEMLHEAFCKVIHENDSDHRQQLEDNVFNVILED